MTDRARHTLGEPPGRDELTAVLEVLGHEVRDQLVSRSFMERQLAAIFGRAGERTSWRKGRVVPTDEIERLLSDDCGIQVVPVPTSSQVTVLEGD